MSRNPVKQVVRPYGLVSTISTSPGTSVPGFHMPPYWGLSPIGAFRRPFPRESSAQNKPQVISLEDFRLLVAQALNRIQLGGAGGGDGPENHSHDCGHDYRDYGGPAVDWDAVLGKEAR